MFLPEPNRWPSWRVDQWPLATTRVTVGELSERLGVAFREVNEQDGLVPARVIEGRLAPDRLIQIIEHELAARFDPLGRTAIYVDAADLAVEGVDKLVEDVMRSLGLVPEDLSWIAEQTSQQAAAKRVSDLAAAPRPPGCPTGITAADPP